MDELYLLGKFEKEVMKGFVPEVSMDLNPKEVEVLLLLKQTPNQPMWFYGGAIGLEKGSFTYLADLLAGKQLIRRIHNRADQRSRLLALTDQGRHVVDQLAEQLGQYMEKRFEVFDTLDLDQLDIAIKIVKRLLTKLPDVPFGRPPR